MKQITISIFLLLFALPSFSQLEVNAGFEAAFKFNDRAENLLPDSGFMIYGFTAGLGYGISPAFKVGLQTGGLFTSEKDGGQGKMSMIPLLLSVGTTTYLEASRITLDLAGGPYFSSRTYQGMSESKALWGIRPVIGWDFKLTENLMLGIKSHAHIIFSNSEDFPEPHGWGNPDKTTIFFAGGTIGLTYVFL